MKEYIGYTEEEESAALSSSRPVPSFRAVCRFSVISPCGSTRLFQMPSIMLRIMKKHSGFSLFFRAFPQSTVD